MNIFQTSLFAIAMGYCLLSAAGLRNLLPQWRLRYFSVFLLLEALGFGFEWLMLHPDTGFKSLWLGGLMQLSLLIAPCLWLCTLEITQQQAPRPVTLPGLHKWLLLVASLCLLPLLLSAHAGTGFGNPLEPVSAYQAMFIHGTMLICIAIFTLQVPMFIARIRLLLQAYEQRIADNFSNLHEHSLHALHWLLLILLVKWLMAILRTLHCMYIGPVGGLGINLFMTIEILFTLRALFALSRLTPVPPIAAQASVIHETLETATAEKYANSALDDATRRRILGKLQDVMEAQKLYTDASLNLRQLSEQLRESSHYLSQVINQELGTSFYEWVNRYRVEAAKQALLNEPDKTILNIAEEVGFNSKSTFNTAFRQYTQMTPSEYRRQKTNIVVD
ncbi:helix-turn-helix domain-containing protein [Cellvibrio mixtus]|uniref:helix-turn-helix domain-containing protein n=1 Tax=Cellvibrio mixtus TaxID=39650 RepID=UPI00069414B5|nr:helix-turn-helix domain-containing protein [Cellvibrio mixtus]